MTVDAVEAFGQDTPHELHEMILAQWHPTFELRVLMVLTTVIFVQTAADLSQNTILEGIDVAHALVAMIDR